MKPFVSDRKRTPSSTAPASASTLSGTAALLQMLDGVWAAAGVADRAKPKMAAARPTYVRLGCLDTRRHLSPDSFR
jgi:hypothetical protein